MTRPMIRAEKAPPMAPRLPRARHAHRLSLWPMTCLAIHPASRPVARVLNGPGLCNVQSFLGKGATVVRMEMIVHFYSNGNVDAHMVLN